MSELINEQYKNFVEFVNTNQSDPIDNRDDEIYVLPEGDYEVELLSIYEHTAYNGNIVIYFNWKILSGDYSEMTFSTCFYKNSSKSMALMEKAIKKMGHVKPINNDYTYIYGSKCIVFITHGKDGFYIGRHYKSIT